MNQTYVIVGANLCGGRAVETLRREGFDGRIVLIGAEPERPYERPPLSKEYLRGEEERDRVFLQPPDYYEQQRIELKLGVRATGIDLQQHSVSLETGERIRFDKLLLATGGKVRRLNVPGAHLDGIYYLRTLTDCERIRSELKAGRKLVVIGAGFIGAEVAASARIKELEVTVLEMAEVPLLRALGQDIGRIYAEIHRDHGIDLCPGCQVERFEGSDRVETVITSDGKSIHCDFVVVGVGIAPGTEWAEECGLEVNNGFIVNEYCETNLEGIFAAGDVANYPNPILGERMRVEHWANAQNQGMAAARNMLGRREAYAEVPWFWSDQYDLRMQYLGYTTHWDELILRGDVRNRKFTGFYLRDNKVRAAIIVNRPRDVAPIRNLIRSQKTVARRDLEQEDADLQKLVT